MQRAPPFGGCSSGSRYRYFCQRAVRAPSNVPQPKLGCRWPPPWKAAPWSQESPSAFHLSPPEQLVVGHVADLARGVADDDGPGGDVPDHDRARADVGLLADLDPRAQDGASADPRTAADRRTLAELVPALGATHEVVVRRHHARRDEDRVLERGVGRDVRLSLDLRQRADRRVVLDERAGADDDVVADDAALPHAGPVADDHARPDLCPREDDRPGGDDGPRPELQGRQLLTLRRRAGREHRLLADDGVLEDPAALADDRPRIDDRRRRDLAHAPDRRSLPPGRAGLHERLAPLTARCSPGPC